MTLYYVNRQIQSNGDHEVHASTCERLPAERYRIYLGSFSNCREALREAQRHYPHANGCPHCARECHTNTTVYPVRPAVNESAVSEKT